MPESNQPFGERGAQEGGHLEGDGKRNSAAGFETLSIPSRRRNRMNPPDAETCIAPGCVRKRRSRGLCQPCSQIACRLIREGTITDEELVDAGLLLPVKAAGPKLSNPLRLAVEKLKGPQ